MTEFIVGLVIVCVVLALLYELAGKISLSKNLEETHKEDVDRIEKAEYTEIVQEMEKRDEESKAASTVTRDVAVDELRKAWKNNSPKVNTMSGRRVS